MLVSGQLHGNTEEAVYETDSIRVRATCYRRDWLRTRGGKGGDEVRLLVLL